MQQKWWVRAVFWLVALAIVVGTPATEAGFFVGGSVGSTSLKDTEQGFSVDVTDSGFKLFGGYRVGRLFAVELNYVDFGNFDETIDTTRFEADARAVTLYAIGILPVSPKLDLYAKLGLAAWESSSLIDDGMAMPVPTDEDGTDVTYAIGVGYRITEKFGLRIEWEKFEIGSVDEVTLISIGASFGF